MKKLIYMIQQLCLHFASMLKGFEDIRHTLKDKLNKVRNMTLDLTQINETRSSHAYLAQHIRPRDLPSESGNRNRRSVTKTNTEFLSEANVLLLQQTVDLLDSTKTNIADTSDTITEDCNKLAAHRHLLM